MSMPKVPGKERLSKDPGALCDAADAVEVGRTKWAGVDVS